MLVKLIFLQMTPQPPVADISDVVLSYSPSVPYRYAAIGLVIIVPEVFALIKVFWHTSFIKRTRTHQWPSGLAIFVVRISIDIGVFGVSFGEK